MAEHRDTDVAAVTTPPGSLLAALEYALGTLRSNQDVLLHKVARTEVVREQLEVNRTAIVVASEALKEAKASV